MIKETYFRIQWTSKMKFLAKTVHGLTDLCLKECLKSEDLRNAPFQLEDI